MTEISSVVLVVEDEAQMRTFVRIALESHGFQMLEAPTAAEGIRQARSYTPDLVLLDLGLPDGDGSKVTRRIREYSSVPILVISARGNEESKIKALDEGADDYLTKPFGAGELMARIRVALRQGLFARGAGCRADRRRHHGRSRSPHRSRFAAKRST